MKEQEIRQKESEINWNRKINSPLLKERFPQVESICISLTREYSGAYAYSDIQEFTFTKSDKSYFKIDCLNPECIYSDLDFEEEIINAVNQRTQKTEGRKICHGWQDFERLNQYKCQSRVDFELVIHFVKS
ncbi:hypothetical protein [Ekhidna sp.]|uniref:hypothetical protein n=1 Tax=Ekhidna sp. TaxID=2608089 RepID=UPI0035180C0C